MEEKKKPKKQAPDMRDWLTKLIDKNRRQIERDLKEVEPKERLRMMEKLIQYVVPKQQAVSAKLDFNQLSDAQLDNLIKDLTKEVEDDTTA